MRPRLEDASQIRGHILRLPRIEPFTVTATGSTNADAAQLYETVNNVLGANATKGVILPVPSGKGAQCWVKNDDTANAVLKVYPSSGQKINGGSADAALSMAAKTFAWFYSIDGANWETLPLLPS